MISGNRLLLYYAMLLAMLLGLVKLSSDYDKAHAWDDAIVIQPQYETK